tara:strand:- start:3989 stop:5329 length:1341 start_codon:yes stop_codon:yes gene_type:complete
MTEMHTDLPKTINEAIKILAYNEYFWYHTANPVKGKINPHHKDLETVRSLAEAQYAWTEKQAKLAVVICKRYLTKFQKHGMDIKSLLDRPQYEQPFRVINFQKSIEKYIEEDIEKIELKFPYDKKLVRLVKLVKDCRGLPYGLVKYDGESKKWTFDQTDVTTYFLTLIAIRYDFKFIDETLLDDFDQVKKEIKGYKQPTARLVGNEIVIDNAAESLQEYWHTNVKHKKPLQQVDHLKEFGITTKGIKVKSYSDLGYKIAHSDHPKNWIDRTIYTRDQLILGLTELDAFPIIMPISGDPYTYEDSEDWRKWLDTFERHGIEAPNLAFGFEMKEPVRPGMQENPLREKWTEKMAEDSFLTLQEVYQLAKQFKYVDDKTKIIFVRNRIPRTLMKSNVKPKCSLVALGGGYYTSGTDNLKRFLDNLPKTLYYNDHQPSNYSWDEKIINKI